MAPKLYGDLLSPCVRAVLFASKAINLELEYVDVKLMEGAQMSPDFLKKNPRHTVPTLEDNGVFLWDSHAIMIYLIQKYAKDNSPLYPQDPVKRAIVNRLLFFEAGELFSSHVQLCLPILMGQMKELEEQRLANVVKAIDFLEIFLKNSKYVAGDELTIADFSIWTTLSNISGYLPIDEKKYPNITVWMKVMKGVPNADLNIKNAKLFKDAITHALA